MPDLNEGEVALTLGDETLTLRPTLNVIRKLSTAFGGLRSALQAVINTDFDGIVTIIKIGGGVPDKDTDALMGKVFRAGITDTTMAPVVSFLLNLQNGGKPPPDATQPPAEASEGNA